MGEEELNKKFKNYLRETNRILTEAYGQIPGILGICGRIRQETEPFFTLELR